MFKKTVIRVIAPLAEVPALVARYRSVKIKEIQTDLDVMASDGFTCPLSAEQLYDLELLGIVYDFSVGGFDVTDCYNFVDCCSQSV